MEFENNHVLVMTAQIFVDILNHAFFSPYQLNLLVFDECHSAVKDAPMRQVLTKLHSCDGNTPCLKHTDPYEWFHLLFFLVYSCSTAKNPGAHSSFV